MALLRKFSPLDGMKKENLLALARKIGCQQLPAGRQLFKEGDRDKLTYWLVSGLIELREGDATVAMIRGGTAEARNPLSQKLPRQLSRARGRSDRVPGGRQRAARHDDHLGSDRHLRGLRSCRRSSPPAARARTG